MTAKKNGVLIPVGQEMALYRMHVDITEVIEDDGPQVTSLKHLMNRMIAFDRKNRPTMATVAQEVLQILGKNISVVL